jgi:hypothetical protein
VSVAVKEIPETASEMEFAGGVKAVTVGAVVSEDARAAAMAATSSGVSFRPDISGIVKASEICLAVLLFFVEVARAPWQLAQLVA